MRTKFFVRCCAGIVIAVLTACGAISTHVASTPTLPTQTGYLQGKVSIGPLRPVERAGEPTPRIPPEVFTSRSIDIFQADGKTRVTNVRFNPDGTYRVELPPGVYVIALARIGIDRARDLPKRIEIKSGETTELDIEIDTGLR